jgi:hypothetical protein
MTALTIEGSAAMTPRTLARLLIGVAASFTALVASDASAQNARTADARAQQVIDHWTPDRRAAAIERHLVIDERGLGYIRLEDGSLQPHGHDVPASKPIATADTAGPSVTPTNPTQGQTIGASATFSATVTDPAGVRSVTFKVQKGSGLAQSFTAGTSGNGVYTVSLSGFTDGAWSWWVIAKDNAKPSNTTTTAAVGFSVNTSGPGGGGDPGGGTSGDTIANEVWVDNSAGVNTAAGRIYFEMPSNKRRTRWAGYVCSGTVVTDGTDNRSTILTAAHCVYDDANKAFARNVMFIPDQDASGTATDRNCDNDRLGCWVPKFGVVDNNWTTRTFPDNVHWDYAFYVVDDTDALAHKGATAGAVLQDTTGTLGISFSPVAEGALTYAIGYSYSEDPKLMYCRDPIGHMNADNYWLPNCGLSGGSSGGPWMQSAGNGPVTSVNSWGYTNSPGMAGPKFSGTSAQCVFNTAVGGAMNDAAYATDGNAGIKAGC